MKNELLKKERKLIRNFLNEQNGKGRENYWGQIYTNELVNSSTLKIVLFGSKIGYKEIFDFCSKNGIVGFEESPKSFGIFKRYSK